MNTVEEPISIKKGSPIAIREYNEEVKIPYLLKTVIELRKRLEGFNLPKFDVNLVPRVRDEAEMIQEQKNHKAYFEGNLKVCLACIKKGNAACPHVKKITPIWLEDNKNT